MNFLMDINGSAYGSDSTYSAIRLADTLAKREGVTASVFLIGDGVTAALTKQKAPDGYYKLNRILSIVTRNGGSIDCCGTCMNARGVTNAILIDGSKRGITKVPVDHTLPADKVLVF